MLYLNNTIAANAITQIREIVSQADGLICTKTHGDAVIEALEHYFG